MARLHEADAMLGAGWTIAHIVQRLGISKKAHHRWQNQYGGIKATDAKRIKQLKQENTRRKKLVADLSPVNAMLKEVTKGEF
ncbi:MAG: transposase [Planctomycetota bacterium]|nr:transposase [Planctomycetota bacterium]